MNNIYKDIEPFIEEIKKYENIAIAGHISPDGDAISASLSLAMTLVKMGKKPIILLENYVDTYNHLDGHHMVFKGDYDTLNIDLFISVDCGDIERLGKAKPIFEKAKKTVNIDHHISNNNFGHLNIVNTQASSTSEIIFEIVNHTDKLDLDIATAIYTGLVFDTCGFKHKSTGKRTHQIAGELINIGVDSAMVHTRLLYTHTLANARLLAKTIQNICVEDNIVISTLTKSEIIEECKASYDDLEGISGYLLDIKGIDVAVFLYEKADGSIKASFRSKTIDVNKIAGSFGGGGHILASGATIKDMSLEQAKQNILEKIRSV